jgi:hypothetical protein
VQQKYGARYLNYWYDKELGKIFYLVEAPSQEAAAAVHREIHGHVAGEIFEVKQRSHTQPGAWQLGIDGSSPARNRRRSALR